MCGFRSISPAEYANLLERAVDIAYVNDPVMPRPRTQPLRRGTRRKLLRVPYEVEKQVPVYKDYIDKGVEKKVVTGTRVVPKRRTKDITTHDVEVTRERVQKNGANVVRRVEEPVDCVVWKHVPVTRMVRKCFVEHEMRPVERVVSMPADRILEKSGVRVDRHMETKLMEVEEDHYYQIRGQPSRSGEACARARVIDDETHGVILPRGTTTWHPKDQEKASRLHSTADPRSKTPQLERVQPPRSYPAASANVYGYNGIMDPGMYQSGHVLGHQAEYYTRQGNRTPPPDLQRKDCHGMDPEARYHPGHVLGHQDEYYTEFEKSKRLGSRTPPVDLQRNYNHEMGSATRYNPGYMHGKPAEYHQDCPDEYYAEFEMSKRLGNRTPPVDLECSAFGPYPRLNATRCKPAEYHQDSPPLARPQLARYVAGEPIQTLCGNNPQGCSSGAVSQTGYGYPQQNSKPGSATDLCCHDYPQRTPQLPATELRNHQQLTDSATTSNYPQRTPHRPRNHPQQNSGVVPATTEFQTTYAATTDAAGDKQHGVPPQKGQTRNEEQPFPSLRENSQDPLLMPPLQSSPSDGATLQQLPPQAGQPRNDHANVHQNEYGQPERSQPPPQSSFPEHAACEGEHVQHIKQSSSASQETIRPLASQLNTQSLNATQSVPQLPASAVSV